MVAIKFWYRWRLEIAKAKQMLEQVKQLRQETGLGLLEIKSALDRSSGDVEKAKTILRTEGKKLSSNNISIAEGIIGYYIHHNNQLGAMVELNCQTDFTARNQEFKDLANKLAMHVVSANPKYVKREDVPQELVETERLVLLEQNKNRPANILEKIITGQMNCFFSQLCLMEQNYVADESVKISDMISLFSKKVGENIVIKRFVRFQVG